MLRLDLASIQRELLILIATFAGAIIAAKVVAVVWERVFLRVASRTRTRLDVKVFQATKRPVYFFAMIFGIYGSLTRFAETVGLREYVAYRYLDGFLYLLLVAAGSILTYSALKGALDWYLEEVAGKTKTDLDEKFLPLVTRLVKLVVFFVGLTIVLDYFELEISGLLATAGVASLAVAFAAQETLSNMISGFLIMVDRPFRPGDRIELEDGRVGDVFEVGLRSTKILSFDHTLIVVPNKDIAGAKIVNHSYPDEKIKVRANVGVAYGTDLELAKGILMDICRTHPKVLSDPAPAVYFTEFGDSSLNLLAICWIADYHDRFDVLDQINMEIDKRFKEQGIEIPFPQRDVHIRTS